LGTLLALCALVATQQAQTPAQRSTLDTVTADQLHALVAEHKGKVVVVNFWATWCPPCKAEFPSLIKFHADYHAKGVEVVAVSMNAEDEADDIDAFLGSFRPPFAVYRAATLDETFYAEAVKNAQWFGELPVTLIFDTAGNPTRYHRKMVTYDDLVRDVTALLPAPAR
jgi:thiol-disulfide isomerase/thioredoxin